MTDTEALKSKAITASLWAIIEKFSFLITQFIIGIILARLLDPSDFGLIALTTIFITISGAITDGGFETALIQRKELSELQVNTAFYTNLFLGVLMAIIIFITAPYISIFFNNLRLNSVLRTLSVLLPLEALGQTQRTLLMKELSFRKISIAQIISSLISGLAGIVLAYCGFGVWALVYSTILALTIRVSILWIKSTWYPKMMFSYSSISDLIPFGLNVLATSIIYFFVQQFNSLIVGKYYNDRQLGFFNRGMKFPEIVISVIQGVILKMSLPLFSKLQDEDEKLQVAIGKTNSLVAFIAFPLLLFLFLDAKEIVFFLLTDKWASAIIFLKIFCLIKLFEPFISIQRELILAKGKSRLALKLFIVTSIFEIVPVLFFARFGISYIVWIVLLNKVFQYLLYTVINSLGLKKQMLTSFKLFLSYTLISIVLFFGVQFFDSLLTTTVKERFFYKLFIDFVVCSSLYLTICLKFMEDEIVIIRNIFSSIRRTPKVKMSKG